MFNNLVHRGRILMCAGVVVWGTLANRSDVAAQQTDAPVVGDLGVGDVAPPLDIAHWYSLGEGQTAEVSDFEAGQIYVVEFWATWCAPCIASMPHLAELAEAYHDRGVRVVSVSNEDPETVTQFLKRPVRGTAKPQASAAGNESAGGGELEQTQSELTYGELTAAYALTTDPDGSVFRDYLEAGRRRGIPYAYIVGKDGLIEWSGTPLELDKPLESIVKGTWDRKAYLAKQQRVQALGASLAQAQRWMGTDRSDEALAIVEKILDEVDDTGLRLGAISVLGTLDPERATKSPLVPRAIRELESLAAGETVPVGQRPFLYYFQARLLLKLGQKEKALELQQQAVEHAEEGPVRRQMEKLLESMRAGSQP